MNQDAPTESDKIRSEIDETRKRMDTTMNKIGERMHGRHIVDEILGLFGDGSSRVAEVGRKVKDKANSAVRTAATTVKENPIPVALVVGGIGWLVYRGIRRPSGELPDFQADPLTGGEMMPGPAGSSGSLGEKAARAKDAAVEKVSAVAGQLKDAVHSVGEGAGGQLAEVRDRAAHTLRRQREWAAHTLDRRPLEVGLGCLALGILAGLALPTPRRVQKMAGRRVGRIRETARQTAREFVEKGKHVAEAAAEAAREDARSQGLTVEALRDRIGGQQSAPSENATPPAPAQPPGGNAPSSPSV